LVMGGSTAA